jgi:serine/threonine protein kinase
VTSGWCVDVKYDQKGTPGPAELALVLEKCDVSLDTAILHSNIAFSKQELISIALDIARGMQFIHSHFMIHKDLKLQNCLIKANEVRSENFG